MNWRVCAKIFTSRIPNQYKSQYFTRNLQGVEGAAARAHFPRLPVSRDVQSAVGNRNQELSTPPMQGLIQSGYSRAARKTMRETHLTLMSCPLRASWTCTIRKINNWRYT